MNRKQINKKNDRHPLGAWLENNIQVAWNSFVKLITPIATVTKYTRYSNTSIALQGTPSITLVWLLKKLKRAFSFRYT